MHGFEIICSTCNQQTGVGQCADLQRMADSLRESTCGNGHKSLTVVSGETTYTPTHPVAETKKEELAAATDEALAAAKSARTVVSALSVVERLSERVVELEKRLGL